MATVSVVCGGGSTCRGTTSAASIARARLAARRPAAFIADDLPAMLRYTLDCDRDWRTVAGHVTAGATTWRSTCKSSGTSRGEWSMNGEHVAGVDGLEDLRLRLHARHQPDAAPSIVADARTDGRTHRGMAEHLRGHARAARPALSARERQDYAYEAPAFGYAEELEVDPVGFVVCYPRLWEAE